MPKIILLPIEPLESRYSIQWKEWFTDAILKDGTFGLTTIYPEPLTKEIENGAFLDIVGTNYYKAKQLQYLCEMFHKGNIKDGDIFFFHDVWFPGIESLAYIRDALGIKFKIVGCLHAGTYDSTDFISKKGMGRWGKAIENGWFELLDQIYVATKYHKQLICKNRNVNPFKIKVTGFPIYPIVNNSEIIRENIVLFPHRMTDDKQHHLFDRLRERLEAQFPCWQFIKTQDVKRSKQEYYDLLNKSKISVSFALHENWGIAMQESVLCGCVPIVPDRLSYTEMYPKCFCYNDFEDCVEIVTYYMKYGGIMDFLEFTRYIRRDIVNNGIHAIPNMLQELKDEK